MTTEVVKNFFMWCSLVNYGILALWCCIFIFSHDTMKNLTEAALRCRLERFDEMQVYGITFYKVGIVLFNLVPWVTLALIVK